MPLEVGDGLGDSMTMLDPLEHSGVSVYVESLSAGLPRMHSGESRNQGDGMRDHSGEDSTHQDLREVIKQAPAGRRGGHCHRGRRLGGTMVSDRLGGRYGS